MKWSEWKDAIWGYQQTVYEPSRGTRHEVVLRMNGSMDGWEVDLYVDVLDEQTDCMNVRMRDLRGTREEAQQQAIAWANEIVEKLGTFFEEKE